MTVNVRSWRRARARPDSKPNDDETLVSAWVVSCSRTRLSSLQLIASQAIQFCNSNELCWLQHVYYVIWLSICTLTFIWLGKKDDVDDADEDCLSSQIKQAKLEGMQWAQSQVQHFEEEGTVLVKGARAGWDSDTRRTSSWTMRKGMWVNTAKTTRAEMFKMQKGHLKD